ncbi:GSCOCG00010806001-RA-CDS [Cotesia congregata]|nr:GSCOCG00010805001-RA-CDS [Cotesia congregata]CAD6209614.1 GSCOCG00010806001-RA-CDS [Cotesia congregata]
MEPTAPAGTNTTTSASDAKSKEQLDCFRCGKIGHLYRECQEPLTLVCYRCGRPGVTVRTCPTCNSIEQGNGQGSSAQGEGAGSEAVTTPMTQ